MRSRSRQFSVCGVVLVPLLLAGRAWGHAPRIVLSLLAGPAATTGCSGCTPITGRVQMTTCTNPQQQLCVDVELYHTPETAALCPDCTSVITESGMRPVTVALFNAANGALIEMKTFPDVPMWNCGAMPVAGEAYSQCVNFTLGCGKKTDGSNQCQVLVDGIGTGTNDLMANVVVMVGTWLKQTGHCPNGGQCVYGWPYMGTTQASQRFEAVCPHDP